MILTIGRRDSNGGVWWRFYMPTPFYKKAGGYDSFLLPNYIHKKHSDSVYTVCSNIQDCCGENERRLVMTMISKQVDE